MNTKTLILLLVLPLASNLHAARPDRPEGPQRPATPTAEQVLAEFDTDGSDTLDEAEIETMLETVRERRREIREKMKERMKERREERREIRRQLREDGAPGQGRGKRNRPKDDDRGSDD